MPPDNLLLMATIGKPHGLKGECHLYSYTDPPEAIFSFSLLQTIDGATITIEKWREASGGFLVKCHGVDDRTAASRLTQQGIFVDRASLPPPPADHHYQHDLIGFAVIGEDEEIEEGAVDEESGDGKLQDGELVGGELQEELVDKESIDGKLQEDKTQGRMIGHVAGFANYGAGDILVITDKNGKEFFLPFQDFAIKKIIADDKKIIIVQKFLL